MRGHGNLVAVDHAVVAMVLGVGGREGGLMGGMWVVLGLVPRRGHDHGQAGAGVTLARSWQGWIERN